MVYLFRYCSLESASASGSKSKPKKKDGGGSLGESLEALRASPKVASLAILVASYGIAHRLFEFAWKGQVSLRYKQIVTHALAMSPHIVHTGQQSISILKFLVRYISSDIRSDMSFKVYIQKILEVKSS